jgi:hydroxymethylglutaryl-CoA lyase
MKKFMQPLRSGCLRFDGAIQGFGGCPMAADALTGNMPTEKLLSYFTSKKVAHGVKWMAFEAAHIIKPPLYSMHTIKTGYL